MSRRAMAAQSEDTGTAEEDSRAATRRGDNDSRRIGAGCGRCNGSLVKDQLCPSHAAGVTGLHGLECGSSCERCASHNKVMSMFFKGQSDDAILRTLPASARWWANEFLDAPPSASTSPGAAVRSAGVAGRTNHGGGVSPAAPSRYSPGSV